MTYKTAIASICSLTLGLAAGALLSAQAGTTTAQPSATTGQPSTTTAQPSTTTAQASTTTADSASVNSGVFTADQAKNGQRLFDGACSSCHTVEQMTGKNFVGSWGGGTLADPFDVMSQTMPDGAPGSLEPGDYASIIAFFMRETGYPSGQQELPSTLEALKKISVDAPKQ